MSKILSFIALRFKLQFGSSDKSNKKGQIVGFLIGLATILVVLMLLKLFFDVIVDEILKSTTIAQFSALLFTIIQLVLIVFGITQMIRNLLKPFDIKITARLPLSPFQMFVAELVMIYTYIFAMGVICYFAIFMVFGWSASIITVGFVFRLLLMTLFAPMIPFVIALVLSVPIMYILNLLQNHNVIKLIIFVALFVLAFIAYSILLDFITEYYIQQKVNADTQNALITFINTLNHDANFLVWIGAIVFGESCLKEILLTLAIFAVGLSIGLVLVKLMYDNIRRQILEGYGKFFTKVTKLDNSSGFIAIFKNEFTNIIRTHSYAYFYLGIAIATPVMVFLCDRLVGKVGNAFMGGGINFGVSILVIVAFMAMINSFASTAISREFDTFYLTKITPISFRKQLLAKGLINMIVSFGALILSIATIVSMEFVEIVPAIVIFVTCMIFAFGMILNGFNINLKSPNLKRLTDGEVGEINIAKCLILGILLCVIEGAVSIILSTFVSQWIVYLIVFGVAIIYTGINSLIFFKTAEKKYANIEYR